ncbi:MAG: carbohydrate porin [Endomicrobium sp.]|jgi:hypothetical protein|nr:carbohydrate porin [Endomicrobium sp.]
MNKKIMTILAAAATLFTAGISSVAFTAELFGIQASGDSIFIIQRMPDVEDVKNNKDLIKATLAFSLKLTKEFENNGKLVVRFKGGEGNGLNENLQIYSKINEATDTDPEFLRPITVLKNTELFYQQSFLDNKFTVNFGKFGLGTHFAGNNYAGDKNSQFLTGSFSSDKTIDAPPPLIALRLNYVMTDIDIDYAHFLTKDDLNLNNFNFNLNKKLDILQVTYKPYKGGNYRIYTWTTNADYYSYENAKKYGTCGIGISADHAINERIGVFARIGHKNPYVGTKVEDTKTHQLVFRLPLSSLWNIGIQIKSTNDDVLGFAIGRISGSSVLENKKIENHKYGTETQIELYYKHKINNNIAVIANLQYLTNLKGGNAPYKYDIVVTGIRALITF